MISSDSALVYARKENSVMVAGALGDLRRGIKLWPFYSRLGLDDIRQRYVRTAIGPFWMIINSSVWILVLAMISASLFKQDLSKTFPFVAAGMYGWLFISACLSESCYTFLNHSWLLTTSALPVSFHLYRHLVRISVTFLHYIPMLLCILMICGVWPSLMTLWLIPVVLSFIVLALWLGVVLGILTMRYRDVPHMVTTVASILPIVSPIAWSRDLLQQYLWLADFNPIYHFVEVLRAAALGTAVPWTSWIAVMAVNACGLCIAFVLYVKQRTRLVMWV